MTMSEMQRRPGWFELAVAIILTVCCVESTAQAPVEPTAAIATLNLTSEERAWIEQNPEVTFTGDPDWLPFEAFDSSGNYSGIVSELLTLIESQTGLQIERVKPDSWSHALELARDGDVMMISGGTINSSLYENFTPTRSYLTSNIVIVMHEDHSSINHLEQIADRKIAIVHDYGYAEDLKKHYPNINFMEVDTVTDGFEAVSEGRVDAILVSNVTAAYHIAHHNSDRVEIVGQTKVFLKASIFVASSEPILNTIIERAVFNIPARTRTDIFIKWIDSDIPVVAASSPLSISAEERRWLDEHSTLRLAGDPDWLPHEAFDSNGNYIGIVAEHVHLVEQLLGIKFEIVQTESWSESVELASSGQVDVLSETTDSSLSDQLQFTDPYLVSRIAMVMRNDNNYVSHLSEVADKRIGVVQDYGYLSKIREVYPDIDFVEPLTLRAGMEMVSTGELDVMLCSLPHCTYQITSTSLSNIRIIGPTEFEAKLALGVQPDLAPLLPLLNRAIAAISEPQRQQILRSWIQSPLLDSVSARYVKYVLWLAALFLAGIVVRNAWLRRRLRRQKRSATELEAERRRAVEANHAKTEFLAAIGHEIHTPMNGVIGMLDNFVHTPLNENQYHTVGMIRDSAGALLNVVDDMLDYSRLEIGQLKINTHATRLDHLIESVVNTHSVSASEKSLPIELFIDPVLRGGIEIDSLRVRQILSNLLGNAIKFTHQGAVEVSASVVERNGKEVTFRLEVKDSGIGIAKESQSKLFESFVQVSDQAEVDFGGSGLGLRICKKLSDKMGGELTLSSEPDIGTTIVYQQQATFVDNEPLASAVSNRRARILCGDDSLVKTVCIYLEDVGVEYVVTDVTSTAIESNDSDFKADFYIVDQHSLKHVDAYVSNNISNPQSRTIIFDSDLRLDQNTFEQHSCSIACYPLLPSTFRMAIRVVSDQYLSAAPKVILPSTPNRFRILVVEDHPTNQYVLRGQLDLLGHRAYVVDNGEAGLMAWRRGEFDAIITDLSMPILDGCKMAALIRSEQPDNQLPIPIIGLTAMTGVHSDDRWRRAGMNECLVKPIDLVTLHNLLQRHVGEAVASGQTGSSVIKSHEIDLNTTLLQQYYRRQDDVQSVLSTFLSNSRRDLDGIHDALANGNTQLLKNRAFALAGAASMIFAPRLIHASRLISESPMAVPRSRLEAMVEEVDNSVMALREVVEEYLR